MNKERKGVRARYIPMRPWLNINIINENTSSGGGRRETPITISHCEGTPLVIVKGPMRSLTMSAEESPKLGAGL
jgi:hypothetical protein